MNKEEYLKQLDRYLKKLPHKDYENAMDYFTEYFEDAGADNEMKIIEELGPPKAAAGELLGNLLEEKTNQFSREGRNASLPIILLTIVLALFAAPAGIPFILTGLAAVLVGILFIFVILAAAVWVDAAVLLESGRLILQGIFALTDSAAGASVFAGAGLLGIGGSLLFALFIMCVCKWIVKGMACFAQWIIKKRSV